MYQHLIILVNFLMSQHTSLITIPKLNLPFLVQPIELIFQLDILQLEGLDFSLLNHSALVQLLFDG